MNEKIGPSLAELEGMSYEELLAEKTTNLVALREIKVHIQEAQARVISERVYASPDWWVRVHAALKTCGLRDQAIAMLQSKRRLERGQAITERKRNHVPKVRVLMFPQVFIEVC